MDNFGVLINIFEDIFDYGKVMFLELILSDIDVDIFLELWLKDWKVV